MTLFSILARFAPNRVFVSMLLGALSGVAYALLIPLVMNALSTDGDLTTVTPAYPFQVLGVEISRPKLAFAFIATTLFVWFARTWTDVSMTRVAIYAASELRVRMYTRIADAPLTALERIGLSRLSTTLAVDVPKIVHGAQSAPGVLIDAVTVVGMMLFLAYLDLQVFWFLLKCIVFGVITTEVILRISDRYHIRAAHVNDNLQEAIHGFVQGFKELKLNADKRATYFEDILLEHEKEYSRARTIGSSIDIGAGHYGQVLGVLFVGSIIFVFVNYHSIRSANLAGIILTLLYVSAPIASLVRSIPVLKQSKVSLKRVTDLLAELPAESISMEVAPLANWNDLRLEQVFFEHRPTGEGRGFAIGPIDLSIRKGNVTFIVGGNGSGKSTLAKILTMHYFPTAGSIYFDNELVTSQNVSSFRQHIAAIYSDYYLFDRILVSTKGGDRVSRYLEMFGLSSKVQYIQGRFSTLALSDGQKRRLALVVAFFEEKDFYLFDEWAADQDPEFKEVFYRQLLPSLKAKGKAVVVITHDDRYFDVADVLVVMDEGKVRSVQHVRSSESQETFGQR